MSYLVDSPISEHNMDGIVENLLLSEHDTVLDIGCGKGTLIRKIHTLYGCTCIGVDISESQIDVARNEIGDYPRVEFHVVDIEQFPRNVKYDLVSCFGNWYGFPGVSLMREFAKPETLYLLGINYWRKDPKGAYESEFGTDEREKDFKTLEQQIVAFYDSGFEILHMYTSSEQERDLYQSHIWRTRQYESQERSRQSKVQYVRWIREYHGWSAWLLRQRTTG